MSSDSEEVPLENLDLVKPAEEPADNVPDAESAAEEEALNREAKTLSNIDTRQALAERRRFLPWVIRAPIVWSCGCFIVVLLAGFHVGGFSLSASALVALITSAPLTAILAFGVHWITSKR